MMNKKILFFIIFLVCSFIDQIIKLNVEFFLNLNQTVLIFPGFLSLEKVYNTGAAFSMFRENVLFLALLSLIILALIIIFVLKKSNQLNKLEIVSLGLISGGALGNLIDRLIRFCVIDFIRFDFIDFPIFNFADIFINIGVIILLLAIILNKNGK